MCGDVVIFEACLVNRKSIIVVLLYTSPDCDTSDQSQLLEYETSITRPHVLTLDTLSTWTTITMHHPIIPLVPGANVP